MIWTLILTVSFTAAPSVARSPCCQSNYVLAIYSTKAKCLGDINSDFGQDQIKQLNVTHP